MLCSVYLFMGEKTLSQCYFKSSHYMPMLKSVHHKTFLFTVVWRSRIGHMQSMMPLDHLIALQTGCEGQSWFGYKKVMLPAHSASLIFGGTAAICSCTFSCCWNNYPNHPELMLAGLAQIGGSKVNSTCSAALFLLFTLSCSNIQHMGGLLPDLRLIMGDQCQ